MFKKPLFWVGLGAVSVLAIMYATPSKADWLTLNSDVNATNFVLADQCSATLISLKYKLVLTANHCIDNYIDTQELDETEPNGEVKKVKREIRRDMALKQNSYQGFRNVGETTYQGVIVAHKRTNDLALLQIRADSIPQNVYSHVLPEGKSVVRGETAYAVGNPLMFDANVSRGIISSTTRMLRVSWADDHEVPFLQSDAAINPGSSGGSLTNGDGELIGVTDASIPGYAGMGLAIPYTVVRDFLKANCYEDVYNAKAQDHDACVKDKRDEENKRREKAGDPPLKGDEMPFSTGDGNVPNPIMDEIRKLMTPRPTKDIAPMDLKN